MKKGNKTLLSLLPALGFLCVAASLLAKHFGLNESFCGFLSGLGSAWVCFGVVGAILKRVNPAYVKRQEIEQKDERNIQMREKAGYVAFITTLFVFVLLGLVFLLLDNRLACILTLCAMAIHLLGFFAALFFYDKKI